jgi:hypothetical protein
LGLEYVYSSKIETATEIVTTTEIDDKRRRRRFGCRCRKCFKSSSAADEETAFVF